MKVKLKGEYTPNLDPLEYILSNRGIKEEDYEKYINPTKELQPDWKKLEGIVEGVKALKSKIDDDNAKIGILIDADQDGLASGSIMYKFLTKQLQFDKERIIVIPPLNKSHGINVERVLEHGMTSGDILITPDSASSDFEQHEELYSKGINTLVIDHHLAPKNKDSKAIIINNQLSDEFENKALTGSAMTYLFCVAYCELLGIDLIVNLKDLAAIGLVADRANFADDLGAYYMMRDGLRKENIDSLMLKMIINKSSNLEQGVDLNAKDIGFNVAPTINAVFRMGKQDELTQVIHGMCEFDYTIHNKRKKMDLHISEEAYLRAMAVKRRQKKQENEVLDKIKERIKEKGSDKHKVLIVNSTGIIENNGLNGLIAMKLAREYGRPVLMVKRIGEYFKGSGRNINNSPIPDLNKMLTDTGLFTCRGHANAFGVEFRVSDALEVLKAIESELIDVNLSDIEYEADFQWTNNLDSNIIHTLANNKDMWCNGIDEPLIHLKNILVRKENIKLIGKTGNTLKINVNGIDCVKFFLKEEQKNEIVTAPDVMYFDLICTASVNSFRGMNTPQLMIEEYSISDAKDHVENYLCEDELPF